MCYVSCVTCHVSCVMCHVTLLYLGNSIRQGGPPTGAPPMGAPPPGAMGTGMPPPPTSQGLANQMGQMSLGPGGERKKERDTCMPRERKRA